MRETRRIIGTETIPFDNLLRKDDDTNQTSALVELCLARAANLAEPLTNSGNAARDAKKTAENGCGTGSAWRANRRRSKYQGGQRCKFFETLALGAEAGRQPTGRMNQCGAQNWLPERNTHPNTVLENRKSSGFSVPLTKRKSSKMDFRRRWFSYQ
jgi:hypothetical protein